MANRRLKRLSERSTAMQLSENRSSTEFYCYSRVWNFNRPSGSLEQLLKSETAWQSDILNVNQRKINKRVKTHALGISR